MADEILIKTIPEHYARQRLDAVLGELFPDYSRSRMQQWIKSGKILLDGQQPRGRDKVQGFETVEIHVEPEPLDDRVEAENIALDLIYEDDDLIVINKPTGLVVHPAAGHRSGTLQNALLHFEPKLVEVPRAGIVHRLDKDTTGLLVVARNLKSHKSLVDQLQARSVHREYQAVVTGLLTAGGTVNEPIGRHPRDRKRMWVREDGKEAITHYRVTERYRGHTLVKVNLETGRTHQIRVHMAYIYHPLVGDAAYGGRLKLPRGASETLKTSLRNFNRQALHAGRLGLIHPTTGMNCEWQSELPEDMQALIMLLREDLEGG